MLNLKLISFTIFMLLSINFNVYANLLPTDLRPQQSKKVVENVGQQFERVIINFERAVGTENIKSLKSFSDRSLLKKQIKAEQEKFSTLVDQNHIKTHKHFIYTNAVAARVTARGMKMLKKMDNVISIDQDKILFIHTAQGVQALNAHNIQSAYTGQGISIAILDTGIDYTHPALGNGSFPNNKVIGGYDFGDNDSDPMDSNGHGTNCAGIAAGNAVNSGNYYGGVARNSKLYALKMSQGSGGTTYTSTMIDAIEWCIDHMNDDPENPLKVVSLSLGGGKYSGECDSSFYSLTNTVANALSAGITIFASSGNEGYCGSIATPACLSGVISVGAVFDADIGRVGFCVSSESCASGKGEHANCDPDPVAWAYTTGPDIVAPYTNMADILDLLAPSHNTTTPTTGGGHTANFGGTSAACPYGAGVAAIMQSAVKTAHDYYLTPAQIRTQLTDSGVLVQYTGENSYSLSKPRIDLGKTDFDSDGLPSEWEIEHFNSIEKNSDDDTDKDGLTELQEYENQTIPTDDDTDDDGMKDGWEVDNSLDPIIDDSGNDPDSDNFTNLEEYQAGTDPNDPDSNPTPLPASNLYILGTGFITMLYLGVIYLRKRFTL